MACYVGMPLDSEDVHEVLGGVLDGNIGEVINDLVEDFALEVVRPDGVNLCGEHLRIHCHSCGKDFSRTIPGYDSDEPSENEKDEDHLADVPDLAPESDDESEGSITFVKKKPLIEIRRFTPPDPNATPRQLFRHDAGDSFFRFTRPRHFLVYAAGACFNQGTIDAKGGCAFISRPGPHPDGDSIVSFRLEERGPWGLPHAQTIKRAQLRAVDAVLRYRFWSGERVKRLIIATDSDYVVDGITSDIRSWVVDGWVDKHGWMIVNTDLWKSVLRKIRSLDAIGVKVLFWRISYLKNIQAICAARKATRFEQSKRYLEIYGVQRIFSQ